MKMVMMRTRKQNLGVVNLVHKFITSAYSSSSSGGGFRPPPVQPQRRVVVTGLGLVTPLGTGVQTSWDQLLAGKTGVRALTVQDLKLTDDKLLQMLPSQVAAPVLHGTSPGAFDDSKWQNLVAPHFITYALCAAEEALTDANWHPQEPSALEHTVLAPLTGGMSFEFPSLYHIFYLF
jgi:3-oxoacyl-[acyl-carrier-protein] synthase II